MSLALCEAAALEARKQEAIDLCDAAAGQLRKRGYQSQRESRCAGRKGRKGGNKGDSKGDSRGGSNGGGRKGDSRGGSNGGGRKAARDRNKRRGKAEYDARTPCGYFLAGHCRFGGRCQKVHSVPYAMAIRDEWLEPAKASTQTALVAAAEAVVGPVASSTLFPRVFSTRLALPEERPHSGPEDGTHGVRYLLILDLEGKDEITEFPVVVVDTWQAAEVGRFQRYCRPVALFEGCALTPESPAISFADMLVEFDSWLHGTVGFGLAGVNGRDAAFLCCGDWDCRHIRTQCRISQIDVPAAFDTWINVKRTFSAAHGGVEIKGMRSMLARLGLLDRAGNPKHGFHHLGMHDTENIGRCVMSLIARGCCFEVNGSAQSREGLR